MKVELTALQSRINKLTQKLYKCLYVVLIQFYAMH